MPLKDGTGEVIRTITVMVTSKVLITITVMRTLSEIKKVTAVNTVPVTVIIIVSV